MKLKRIVALPFALVADAVSLGNIGGNRSFTQQVFDAERAEQYSRECKEVVEVLTALIQAVKDKP